MSLLPRILATQAAHRLPALTRSVCTARPLRVSGYGKNPSVGQQQVPVDDNPGSRIPEYSGPSIAEKRSGRADHTHQEQAGALKNKRDKEFAEDAYEKPQSLSSDGSDWDGKIHQTDRHRTNQSREHDTTGKPKKKPAKIQGDMKDDLGKSKRSLTTSAPTLVDWDRNDSITDDLKDDARRLKDKAGRKLDNAKLAASDVSDNLKHSAEELWDQAKKAGKSLKQAAKSAITPEYADSEGKKRAGLYPVSDSEGARTGFKFPASSPEESAQASGATLGEDVDSVRKGFFDGPQDMPQGVGRRAVNEEGEPMETGTRGS